MDAPWRRPGFTIPGNAEAAGRKSFEMGVGFRFSKDNPRTREIALMGVEARRAKRDPDVQQRHEPPR